MHCKNVEYTYVSDGKPMRRLLKLNCRPLVDLSALPREVEIKGMGMKKNKRISLAW